MTALAILALVAVLEAVVWLDRLRTARGASAWRSGLSAFLVTLTRVLFLWAGVQAVMRDAPAWAVITAYCVPAALATVAVHALVERSPRP